MKVNICFIVGNIPCSPVISDLLFAAMMAAEESTKETISSSQPVSPSSEGDSLEESDNKHQTASTALDAAKFHCGLINLKQIQERSFSFVNQAILRQKMVEEQIKIERDMSSEAENNNDQKSLNNNTSESLPDSLSLEEARRRFLTESSAAGAGRLAFSVENILAPGKFGREMEGDQEQYGRHRTVSVSV